MKHILILIALITNIALAKDCTYKIAKEDFKVSWTAFKTPLKVGVGGAFTKLGTANESAKSFNELLTGIKFNIDTKSTSTKNPDRDKKIVTFFFENMMGGTNISGTTESYAKKVLKIKFNMNKKSLTIPLKVTKTNNSFMAEGVIDVLDFGLNKSLAGINKACYELHEGKTWSDVGIKLEAKYTKVCK